MMELVGIDLFPYVSCFGDSFDDKDPEFPVTLPLRMMSEVTVFFDMLKTLFVSVGR
jgi:hypothetical protein